MSESNNSLRDSSDRVASTLDGTRPEQNAGKAAWVSATIRSGCRDGRESFFLREFLIHLSWINTPIKSITFSLDPPHTCELTGQFDAYQLRSYRCCNTLCRQSPFHVLQRWHRPRFRNAVDLVEIAISLRHLARYLTCCTPGHG
jgi:hypothetical protein